MVCKFDRRQQEQDKARHAVERIDRHMGRKKYYFCLRQFGWIGNEYKQPNKN